MTQFHDCAQHASKAPAAHGLKVLFEWQRTTKMQSSATSGPNCTVPDGISVVHPIPTQFCHKSVRHPGARAQVAPSHRGGEARTACSVEKARVQAMLGIVLKCTLLSTECQRG